MLPAGGRLSGLPVFPTGADCWKGLSVVGRLGSFFWRILLSQWLALHLVSGHDEHVQNCCFPMNDTEILAVKYG